MPAPSGGGSTPHRERQGGYLQNTKRRVTTFECDADGNVVAMTRAGARTERKYDAKGRVWWSKRPEGLTTTKTYL